MAIAVSELTSAGVELAHAKRSLERARINRAQKEISKSQFDDVRMLFETAQVTMKVHFPDDRTLAITLRKVFGF